MGLNMDGLSPELRKKVQKLIVDDGKISETEFKGLSEAEQNQLREALGGSDKVNASLDETGDCYNLATEDRLEQTKWVLKKDENNETNFWDRDKALAKAKKDYYLNNDKTSTWDKIKNWGEHQLQDAGIIVAGTLVVLGGGKLLKPLGKVGGKLLNALKGAKMPTAGQVAKTTGKAAVVGGAVVGIVACGKIDTPTPPTNVTVNTDIDVSVIVKGNYDKMGEYLKDLIELEKQGQEADAARHADLMSKLDELINAQKAQGETITAILLAMKNQGLALDKIVVILQEQGNTLKAITEALAEICNNDEEIINILKASGADTKAILEALNENNRITGKNQELLKEILAKLKDYGDDDTETNKLLNAILNKLADFEKQEFKMDEKTHGLLQALLALGETSVNLQVEGFDKIIDKLNEIIGKMPNGCKCDTDVIIQKLQEIINKLYDNDSTNDPKNESILDDLDNYFG